MAPIAGKWIPGLEDVHGHCGDGGVRAMAMLLFAGEDGRLGEEDGGGDVSDKIVVLTEIMVVVTEMGMMKRMGMEMVVVEMTAVMMMMTKMVLLEMMMWST